MNQKKSGLSEREEQMVQDFLNDSAGQSAWEKRFGKRGTLQGRLEFAAQEEGTTESHRILIRFIIEEIALHGMISARLRVYSPPFGKMCGQILIEAYNSDRGNLFFEIALQKTTDFLNIKMEDMGGDTWSPFFRYHNIAMDSREAVMFLKELLFYNCFTHVFLMTTASDALGVMTTHDLISDAGEVLSFRRWSLSV